MGNKNKRKSRLSSLALRRLNKCKRKNALVSQLRNVRAMSLQVKKVDRSTPALLLDVKLMGKPDESTSLAVLEPVNLDNLINEEITMNTVTVPGSALYEGEHSNVSPENIFENMEKNENFVIEYQKEDYQPISGRRIVDIVYIISQLQERTHHVDLFDCKVGYFKLIGEKRIGLISKFKLQCSVCRNIVLIDSDKSSSENLNVNVAATTGIVAAGVGYSQFEEILSAINVPVFSQKYFSHQQNSVYETWEKTAANSMEDAANREKEAAITEGRVKTGMPIIDVYVDGAWGLRSYGNNYRAMSGVAAIIGRKFGELN